MTSAKRVWSLWDMQQINVPELILGFAQIEPALCSKRTKGSAPSGGSRA
jgi:hypothetical protein